MRIVKPEIGHYDVEGIALESQSQRVLKLVPSVVHKVRMVQRHDLASSQNHVRLHLRIVHAGHLVQRSARLEEHPLVDNSLHHHHRHHARTCVRAFRKR